VNAPAFDVTPGPAAPFYNGSFAPFSPAVILRLAAILFAFHPMET
jgi:hypothetical protein